MNCSSLGNDMMALLRNIDATPFGQKQKSFSCSFSVQIVGVMFDVHRNVAYVSLNRELSAEERSCLNEH